MATCIPCVKAQSEAESFSYSRTIQKAKEVAKQNNYEIMVIGAAVTPSGKKHFAFRPYSDGTDGLTNVEYYTFL